jgi:hypothetical protein
LGAGSRLALIKRQQLLSASSFGCRFPPSLCPKTFGRCWGGYYYVSWGVVPLGVLRRHIMRHINLSVVRPAGTARPRRRAEAPGTRSQSIRVSDRLETLTPLSAGTVGLRGAAQPPASETTSLEVQRQSCGSGRGHDRCHHGLAGYAIWAGGTTVPLRVSRCPILTTSLEVPSDPHAGRVAECPRGQGNLQV